MNHLHYPCSLMDHQRWSPWTHVPHPDGLLGVKCLILMVSLESGSYPDDLLGVMFLCSITLRQSVITIIKCILTLLLVVSLYNTICPLYPLFLLN